MRRWKDFAAMAAKLCVIKEKDLLKATKMVRAVIVSSSCRKTPQLTYRFHHSQLRSLGSILVVDDRSGPEPLYVILRPQWLLTAFTMLVNLKPNYVRNSGGVLQHADFQKVWMPPEYPDQYHYMLVDALRKHSCVYVCSFRGC
jgi:hypothetical protein